MLNVLFRATENFFIHQIRALYQSDDSFSKMRTVVAYIDVNASSGLQRVYVATSFGFAQRVSTLLLEELESDEETLVDMVLELTNLIVGSAKILAQESGLQYHMQTTPVLEKIGFFDLPHDCAKTLKIDDDEITIAISLLQ